MFHGLMYFLSYFFHILTIIFVLNFTFCCRDTPGPLKWLFGHETFRITEWLVSLLNKVPRVLKCLNPQVPFECLSAQVPECPSTQEPWVPECLKGSSAQVSKCLKCPWSALGVLLECSLSVLFEKKVCNITMDWLLVL